MNSYLMAISIGPVQGFISAARRTRDFWMGSTILSEVAKSVAFRLHDKYDAELIFPGTDNGPRPNKTSDLEPLDFSDADDDYQNDFNVTNVILCMVSTDEPDVIANDLNENAAIAKFEEIAEHAREASSHDIEIDRWNAQKNARDIIEFYASWVLFHLQDDYPTRRHEAMQLLSGRKALRDFNAWQGEPLIPKSSLDGARETVLKKLTAKEEEELERKGESRLSGLRAKTKEQLDIVGVTKRAEYGHNAVRYPSVSRIAAQPWIEGVMRDTAAQLMLQDVVTACRSLKDLGALRERSGRRSNGKAYQDFLKYPWIESFPFEGVALFVDRHTEIFRECPFDPKKSKLSREAFYQLLQQRLDLLASKVELLTSEFDKPFPYLVPFVADGDYMGRFVSAIDSIQTHQLFSSTQSDFASRARTIINDEYCGACAYAGADDILGFLPLHCWLDAVRKLHDTFELMMTKALPQDLLAKVGSPTLSVGVAIGHFMEPLEDLLEFARAAEKRAKNPTAEEIARGQTPRNGLAVAMHTRGGAPFMIRDNWSNDLDGRIHQWAKIHRQELLPTKAAYDLRRVAHEYQDNWSDQAALSRALRADAIRTLGRKRQRSASGAAKTSLKQLINNIERSADLEALSLELMLGQNFAIAKNQAEGRQRVASKADQEQQDG